MTKAEKSEYDRQYYLRHREAKLELSLQYGKTERGREVNRRASKRHKRGGVGAAEAKRTYQNLKQRGGAEYEEHLRRKRAQNAVHYALKTGKLKRGTCEVCGSPDVHAHHDDYDRKLDVRWLCPLHHGYTRRKGVEYGQ